MTLTMAESVSDRRTEPLRGIPEARLYPEPLRPLTPETTEGFAFAEFCSEVLRTPLLPWQDWLAKHALELLPDGSYRYRQILILVARQNGKTHLLKCLALYFMYVRGVRLVLGAAQNLDIAKEAWGLACEMVEDIPDLKFELQKIRLANGEQELMLTNGARYKITAANGSAGRGLSVDLLILDELREQKSWDAWSALSKTTTARPDAITICISNAGDDESVVLNALRESALSGEDESLGIFEWSAPDGCDLHDPEGWAQANPALGHTITERTIKASLSTDPPGVFRTEVLCQRVEHLDTALDMGAWRDCSDKEGSLDSARDRVVACIDVARDQKHVTLTAAALQPDGRVRVELVDAWESVDAARAALPDLLSRVNPKVLGWFPGGPSAALAADLKDRKNTVELKAGDVPAVCQGFAEQVTARKVRHADEPLLTAQVAGASKLYSGDGWRFTRKGIGHADAVYAAAGSVHLARTLPKGPGRIRIVTV